MAQGDAPWHAHYYSDEERGAAKALRGGADGADVLARHRGLGGAVA